MTPTAEAVVHKKPPTTVPLESLRVQLTDEDGNFCEINSSTSPLWKHGLALLQPFIEGRARFVDKDGNIIQIERIACDAEKVLASFGIQTRDEGALVPQKWIAFVVEKP